MVASERFGWSIRAKARDLKNLGLSLDELATLGPLSGKPLVYAMRLRNDYRVSGEVAGWFMAAVKDPAKHYDALLNEFFSSEATKGLTPDQVVGRYFSDLETHELADHLVTTAATQPNLEEYLRIDRTAPEASAILDEAETLYDFFHTEKPLESVRSQARVFGVDNFVAEALYEVDPLRVSAAIFLVNRGLDPQLAIDAMHLLDEPQYQKLFVLAHLVRHSVLNPLANHLLACTKNDVPLDETYTVN